MAVSSPAFSKCYSMKEAEAEQGIRIHSELMVIGLNCQHLWPKSDKNLYTQYKNFTTKNAHLFSGYEKTLLKFYRSEGISSPEQRLHQVRTDFANKISKDAAVMRPDSFCAVYAPRIPKANKMDVAQIKKWAATIFPSHPVSHPICAKD
ncbi:MAG: hypothetical protein AUJ12_09440 [Alphaproteobacteria bacterium CG1_02_46_17]|nr:MAG: hypothetical protein AUJ12_09440 [Alphaproteobacteria bacterium CG1_02_46_17]